jgi:uncharacterized membrane protein YphA (DoxX/SURF4 family)
MTMSEPTAPAGAESAAARDTAGGHGTTARHDTADDAGGTLPGRPGRWAGVRPWLAPAGRVLLGLVWIVAGASKITDLGDAVRSVRAYRLLPEWAVPAVGAGLPFLEIALGVLLIVGFGVRLGAVVSAALLVVFITGIASASARGLRIDCGCFGGGGDLGGGQQTNYGSEIARDVGLLVVAGLLAWRPAGRLSVDGWIAGPPSDAQEGVA